MKQEKILHRDPRVQALLDPTGGAMVVTDGYWVHYHVPQRVRKTFQRFLFGYILTQRVTVGGRYHVRARYYPGYLHDIPHQREVRRFFIADAYNLEPIFEICSKYCIKFHIEHVVAHKIHPDAYSTGFQHQYKLSNWKRRKRLVDWSRGVVPELLEKLRWMPGFKVKPWYGGVERPSIDEDDGEGAL